MKTKFDSKTMIDKAKCKFCRCKKIYKNGECVSCGRKNE